MIAFFLLRDKAINGVDVKQDDAIKSKKLLAEEVTRGLGVRADCLRFESVYNTNEPLFLDWMEAYFQRAGEASDWWRNYLRYDVGNRAIDGLFNGTIDFLADLVKATANTGQWVLGEQKAEHLARFRTEINTNGRRLILVPHSQGNLYANEEYAALTATERANTHIVATATPSSFVADGGPYISVNEDLLASTIFALGGALPTNTPNLTVKCAGNLASINRWTCHGFKEEYLATGKLSRDKIVGDIIATLPTTPTQNVKYWSTTLGNPGIPGDGVVVNAEGDYIFSLQPTLPVEGITNGITVSIFPPSDISVQHLSMDIALMVKGKSTGECYIDTAGELGPYTLLSVHSTAGTGVTLPQFYLETLISFLQTEPKCQNVSLSDIFIGGIIVTNYVAGTYQIVPRLDAIAIGIGENAFPTDTTAP